MILHRMEDAILVGLLLLMIGMSVTQIFLRNLFESGIVWSDVMVRILVLWVGLVGAMVASRQDNHITIDILDRYLPEPAKVYANVVVKLFTALICTIVAYYSLLFVQMEFADGGMAFCTSPELVMRGHHSFCLYGNSASLFLINVYELKKNR